MATIEQQGQLFISYAREDKPLVAGVVRGLRQLGKDVWLDEQMHAGQAWWDEILEHVRDCDVFLQVISRAALESEACDRERKYARGLGKPLLPILVDDVDTSLLPADLAVLQCVAYNPSNPQHAFELVGALERCATAGPLPDPLPAPPPIPVSYLGELGDRLRAATLSQDEQAALVSRLRPALERPDQAASARELLERLRHRPDVFHAIARDIDAALAGARATAEPIAVAPPPAVAARPVATARPVPPAPVAEKVPAYMGRAVVTALLIVPLGIFAIIAAAKVGPAAQRGDLDTARKLSRRVLVLFRVTIGITGLIFLLTLMGSAASA